jgi:hypothetical protein
MHQRPMPRRNAVRSIDELVEHLLAYLHARIVKQRRHGGDVARAAARTAGRVRRPQAPAACQQLDDFGWRIGDILERLGDNLPDLRDLIANQDLQDLVGQAAQAVLLLRVQAGG